VENIINSRTQLTITALAIIGFADIAIAQLPDPGVTIVPGRTALLITDPQNDFLSPDGVTWGVVGKSVTDNKTVENIDSLFKAAKANDMPVFISCCSSVSQN
jgi:isochorismate hydrolase